MLYIKPSDSYIYSIIVTDSSLAALSEPWHPIVYKVLVPLHLFIPSCNILSCTIVNATMFTKPPDLVP